MRGDEADIIREASQLKYPKSSVSCGYAAHLK
jgi:hypothetical protein